MIVENMVLLCGCFDLGKFRLGLVQQRVKIECPGEDHDACFVRHKWCKDCPPVRRDVVGEVDQAVALGDDVVGVEMDVFLA